MIKKLPTITAFKKEAKTLKSNNKKIPTYGNALDLVAKEYGYKNFHTIKPLLKEPLFILNTSPEYKSFPAYSILLGLCIVLSIPDDEINNLLTWYKENTVIDEYELFEMVDFISQYNFDDGEINDLYAYLHILFYSKVIQNIYEKTPEDRKPLDFLEINTDYFEYAESKFSHDRSFLDMMDSSMIECCFEIKGKYWEGYDIEPIINPISIEDFTKAWKEERVKIGETDKIPKY